MNLRKTAAWLLTPGVILVAGCGGRVPMMGADPGASLTVHAAATRLDTGRTTRLTATLADGEPARPEEIVWSLTGGDPKAGPGSVSSDGLYTPPSYLTEDAVTVEVSATLAGHAGLSEPGTAALTVTPGFLQPLTPGNLSLGPGGSVTVSGSMTEVGGSSGIRFALASDTAGTPSVDGWLSAPHCVRGSVEGSNPAYTVCSVTYTAPAVLAASGSVYIVGTVDAAASASPSDSRVSWTRVLLNAAGISSNPVSHQARLAVPVQLGSSSGSNTDYDSVLGQLIDCCGGTLGALLQDAGGIQFVLSNNHVFARSDQAIPGETIIQPGLIDNGCTPYGVGPGTTPVATLTGYPALASPATNVDAAIARVTPGLVDAKGSILELGAKQLDGTLAAAPPGISSSGGKGEAAALGMAVAKSGRTTGLTCASVSAVDVDVVVDYFNDCAETVGSRAKTFTNQIAIAGTNFSDAGDSGALVVDVANAEPVGLFFAGGTDATGLEQAIANPAGEVLAALDSQIPPVNAQAGANNFSFVGGADHSVSCLSYDSAKSAEDGAAALSPQERERVEAALPLAQALINPAAGIVRAGIAASKDRPGEGSLALYLETGANPGALPANLGGVATMALPANGSNGGSSAEFAVAQPRAASFNQALAVKQRIAASLLRANSAIFGIGVGQSLDNPADAALILYVDRNKFPGKLPEVFDSLSGIRVRAIRMDRLHVTRSHGLPGGSPNRSGSTCLSSRAALPAIDDEADRQGNAEEPGFNLEDRLDLPD